jgi:hypothetical protein
MHEEMSNKTAQLKSQTSTVHRKQEKSKIKQRVNYISIFKDIMANMALKG